MPATCDYRVPHYPKDCPKSGTEVRFSGLVGRKHLNGCTGIVVPHINGKLEDTTHRCRVQITNSSHTVKVLARNVTVVEQDTRINAADKIDVIVSPTEDHLVLPTTIKLNIDKGIEVKAPATTPRGTTTNRICTAKGSQPLGETYAAIQASSAGRDPGRLRHAGLSFFKDNGDEEAHPTKNRIRTLRSKDTFMHTMRSGYDWRGDGLPMYTDTFHIPVAQGGHGAAQGINSAMLKDSEEAEADVAPTHPRLRGLLLDQDLDKEVIYPAVDHGYKQLLLFTKEGECMQLKDVGGPIRCAAQRERDFKRKEHNREKLLKTRVTLSIQPPDDRELPLRVQWTGRAIDSDGTWDPMASDIKNRMLDADGSEAFTLEQLMNRPDSRAVQGKHPWDPIETDGQHVHQAGRGDSPTPQPMMKEDPQQAPDDVKYRTLEAQEGLSQLESLRTSARPWTDDVIQDMLGKSAEDAAKGFNYGLAPGTSSPWYQQGELASSMLTMDLNPSSHTSGRMMGGDVTEADWAEIEAAAAATAEN